MKHQAPINQKSSAVRQRGVTLLVAMVFLVIITVLVASAIKVNMTNSKIVGNLQIQRESDAAAQQAIETVIGSDFVNMPTASTHTIDINNSGKAGYTYTVNVPAPTCIGSKPIKLSELDLNNAAERPCTTSLSAQNTGLVGNSSSGDSLCSNSLWNVSATPILVDSGKPGATTSQGIAMLVAAGSGCDQS